LNSRRRSEPVAKNERPPQGGRSVSLGKNVLRCESCGREVEHAHESAICTACGHICKLVPPEPAQPEEADTTNTGLGAGEDT
jgi:hypothetical protein